MKKLFMTFCAVTLLSTAAPIAKAEGATSTKGIEQYEVYNHKLLSWNDTIKMVKLNSIKWTVKKYMFTNPIEVTTSVHNQVDKQEVTKESIEAKPVENKEIKPATTQEPKPVENKITKPVETQEPMSIETQVTKPVEKPEVKEQPKEEAPIVQQPVKETTDKQTNSSSEIDVIEVKVVELTNAERAKYGLNALQTDKPLMAAAREKSQDMKNHNYFSHTSPTFGSPFDRLNALGISYQSAGENIAKGQTTAEQVVKAWMNSEGHRKNILDANFTHIGVGYVKEGHIWTQQFIKK